MWLGYRPIDTPGTEMYHPSNGSPRTANTWGYIAVPDKLGLVEFTGAKTIFDYAAPKMNDLHEKQEANRAATASHGELPRLPSRKGMKRQKLKGRKKTEGEIDTRVPRGREARHT
ncbi:hypothetical protein AVEN_246255-1 [Araneus ventricosus]|uniref:Uncharacterized protein n=1 Tax=Araneus ventricosus TaxID=182803 RepID=A0A4Y2LAY5_ARAVE|nr:hypothetical protein AVEN_246255-1 [Araneus ventricosus]